ncbi:hypothetical protein ASG45_11980 [Microbacterium sp. Leaf436]|nr:hypothetical protein ASG45_11980 [Microbacterium sp. Leaf436]
MWFVVRRRTDGAVLTVSARIPTDPSPLHDDRRHGIPFTVVTCTLSADDPRPRRVLPRQCPMPRPPSTGITAPEM